MIKRIMSVVILLSIMTFLNSCSESSTNSVGEYYSATFFAMDTEVTVKLAKAKTADGSSAAYFDDAYLSGIIKECADIASEKEALLSRTKSDSVVAELNTETDYFVKPEPEVLSLISKSTEISKSTDGAFDITVGSITELWNITGNSPTVPEESAVHEALSHVGYDKIITDNENFSKTDRKTKIDLGAIGKGYTLGCIIEHLKATDVQYGVVSFGGNVGVFGKKPNGAKFKVGITDAENTSSVIGYAYIEDGYVSVSGDYERYFIADGNKYSHIFDPSTGRPAKTDITSVAVICDDPSLADALSTALFVKGSDEAMDFYIRGTYKFEAVIQTADGSLLLTDMMNREGAFEKYVPVESSAE